MKIHPAEVAYDEDMWHLALSVYKHLHGIQGCLLQAIKTKHILLSMIIAKRRFNNHHSLHILMGVSLLETSL